MSIVNAKGLVPPVFTPFNADLSVNYNVIPAYMQFLVKENIKAILVGGTTGEAMAMTVAERKKLTESWVSAAKPFGVHVMVQVGGAPLPDVLELAKHAESVKADSLLTLPELYFKPSNVEELVSYVELVGKAAPTIPVLYYHIPAMSCVSVNMPQFITAATARIPNFKGIKFTCNDLNEAAQTLKTLKSDQDVYLGADTLLAPAALLGFQSSIGTTYNIVPSLAWDLLRAIETSNIDKALASQKKIAEFVEALVPEGNWVPVMKVGMEMVTGIKVGPPRLPQKPLTEEQRLRIQGRLRKIGLLK